MREAQESKLGPIARANGWSLDWHDTVEGVSHDAHKFTLVLAHEFFDALPFHLLQVREPPDRYQSPVLILHPRKRS